MANEKLILDACCGGRMMWFNKHHPNALYQDKRELEKGNVPNCSGFEVNPDVIGDFTQMTYPDKMFKMVVFDPPHANINESSLIAKKYGTVKGIDTMEMLTDGFSECWRVLDDYGTLIFKWNEVKYKIKDIRHTFPAEPLFGHTTAKSGNTKWVTFMKIPNGNGK